MLVINLLEVDNSLLTFLVFLQFYFKKNQIICQITKNGIKVNTEVIAISIFDDYPDMHLINVYNYV